MANRINVAFGLSIRMHVSKWAFVSASLVIAGVGSIAHSAIAAGGGPIPFELVGTVVDRETREPIAGAYVIAGYHQKVSDPAVVKQWCVKTRGMYTGIDGKYHFPVESLDGMSPASVSAIKPGYYFQFVEGPDERVWKRQDARSYADRTILLSKQDPKNVRLRYGPEDSFCNHAKTSADAAASVEFLKIQLSEYSRLGASALQVGAVRDMIERLQGIDQAPPGALNPKVKP